MIPSCRADGSSVRCVLLQQPCSFGTLLEDIVSLDFITRVISSNSIMIRGSARHRVLSSLVIIASDWLDTVVISGG